MRRASVALIFVLLLGQVGCAHTPTASESKVILITASLDVAHVGYRTWNIEHQKQLVDQAVKAGKTAAEAQAILADFRQQREAVIVAFLDAFQAAVTALKDPSKLPELLVKVKTLAQMAPPSLMNALLKAVK